jgi:hypothetical protein
MENGPLLTSGQTKEEKYDHEGALADYEWRFSFRTLT